MSAISDYIKFLNNKLMKVDITKLYQDDTGIEGMIVISRKYPGQKIPCLRISMIIFTNVKCSPVSQNRR